MKTSRSLWQVFGVALGLLWGMPAVSTAQEESLVVPVIQACEDNLVHGVVDVGPRVFRWLGEGDESFVPAGALRADEATITIARAMAKEDPSITGFRLGRQARVLEVALPTVEAALPLMLHFSDCPTNSRALITQLAAIQASARVAQETLVRLRHPRISPKHTAIVKTFHPAEVAPLSIDDGLVLVDVTLKEAPASNTLSQTD